MKKHNFAMDGYQCHGEQGMIGICVYVDESEVGRPDDILEDTTIEGLLEWFKEKGADFCHGKLREVEMATEGHLTQEEIQMLTEGLKKMGVADPTIHEEPSF